MVLFESFCYPHLIVPWESSSRVFELGRNSGSVIFARLKDGVRFDAARKEFQAIAQRLASLHSSERTFSGKVEIHPFVERSTKGGLRIVLFAIFAATFLVLLLACSNVANLLLARATERGKELAVRSALGASRARILRQMLTESVIIAIFGALAGMLISQWSIQTILNYLGQETGLTGGAPFWINFGLDGRILGFVLCTMCLASIVSGIVPAL